MHSVFLTTQANVIDENITRCYPELAKFAITRHFSKVFDQLEIGSFPAR